MSQNMETESQNGVKADLLALTHEAKSEEKTESSQFFETSPIGLWQSAIRECVPVGLSLIPDLAINDEETEALASGLAPALAKHFPISESFELPVELTAIIVVYTVFNPKIQAIRAKNAEKPKEVNPDVSATENA